MSLILVNALLILLGPFLAVAPGAIATHLQLEPQRRGPRRRAVRHPAYERAMRGSWAVA